MTQGIIGFLKFMIMLSAVMVLFTTSYNLANPWEGDLEIEKYSSGYIALPIGGSSTGDVMHSRSYALIPASLSAPKMLFLSKSTKSEFVADIDHFAFWLFGTIIVYGWYLIIKFLRAKRLAGSGVIKT